MRTYDLGIIIPVYRSKESVRLLVERLESVFLPDIRIRICIVDDSGDPDVARYLEENCMRPEVSLLVLEKNSGQQAAVLCGLEHMEACAYYGTIDDDLEQPPEALRKLYDLIREGYDLVYGIPCQTGRPLLRRLGSRMRDLLFSRLLGVPAGIRVSSLRVMTDQTAREACSLERSGFFYLSAAVFKAARTHGRAFNVVNQTYTPASRYQGESGYRLGTLIRLYLRILKHYYLPGGTNGTGTPVYRLAKTVRPPRLMVLGGSNCQINAVRRAASQGIDTVLADYTDCPPAAAEAGIHVQASTFDVPACIEAARRFEVTGVMTMGTDQPVYTAACVSRACGCPSLLSEAEALSVTNKKVMKQILTEAGIPTAPYRIVDCDTDLRELEELRTPLVLKPLDSQGQRGIFLLDSPKDVQKHLGETLSFSRCREALVEEYYQSDEVTVSGWIRDGRLAILTVTDRLLYPDPVHIGVCTGHRFPSVHMNRYEEIEALCRRIVEAFHLKNGPFYLQILIGSEGIRVNELASRIGGAFEDVFILYVTGFDILQAVIDAALGKDVSLAALDGYRADRSGKRVAVQLLFCKPGKVAEVTPLEEICRLPYILDAGYNYGPGSTVPVMENATARFGHAVLCGDEGNIKERTDDFYRRLSVKSEAGEELSCRFYP